MRSRRTTVAIVVLALGLVGVFWAVARAEEKLPDGSLVGFILAPGTAATIGDETTILFTGVSQGEDDAGGCLTVMGQLHGVLIFNPDGPLSHANIIVTSFVAEKGVDVLLSGTRLRSIESKESTGKGPCQGIVSYHGIVQ
jgi:hypothetical protein